MRLACHDRGTELLLLPDASCESVAGLSVCGVTPSHDVASERCMHSLVWCWSHCSRFSRILPCDCCMPVRVGLAGFLYESAT